MDINRAIEEAAGVKEAHPGYFKDVTPDYKKLYLEERQRNKDLMDELHNAHKEIAQLKEWLND